MALAVLAALVPVLPGGSAPAQAQARARAVRALPPAVIGLWAYEPADCDNPDSDGHLTIGKRTVLFFASGYDIKRVVRRPDGSLRASGFRADEGEAGRTRDGLTLKLQGRDRLYVNTGGPDGHVYHRCKQARR